MPQAAIPTSTGVEGQCRVFTLDLTAGFFYKHPPRDQRISRPPLPGPRETVVEVDAVEEGNCLREPRRSAARETMVKFQ